MAEFAEINGVAAGDIAEIQGVAIGSVAEVAGTEKPVSSATRWLVGGSAGKIYHTATGSADSGWVELVDLGHSNMYDIAYGQDALGQPRWVSQTQGGSEEIMYASASADLTDTNNWTTVNHSTNYVAEQYGPALAWGNDVWISGGKQVHDGDSYVSIMRSTDGAITWTAVDEGNTVNDKTNSIAYKVGSTWFAAHQSHIWKSTDNGANWTDTITVDGTRDIHAMAYDGTSRWVAVFANGKIWTSDDDWANATERTGDAGAYHCSGVVYAAGSINKWIVVSASGRLQQSSDGVTWSAIWEGDDANWGTSHIAGVATDNTTIVIVGSDGKIATSTNGTSFTVRTIDGNPTIYLRGVACNIIGAGMR